MTPTIVRRPALVIVLILLGVLAPRRAHGQRMDTERAPSRVRAGICRDASGAADVHVGSLYRIDSVGVALEEEPSSFVSWPAARVRSLDHSVRRGRDLRAVGIILGMVAGGYSARYFPDAGSGLGLLVLLPVGVLSGGAAGFAAGGILSYPDEWRPVALPASYGTACGDPHAAP